MMFPCRRRRRWASRPRSRPFLRRDPALPSLPGPPPPPPQGLAALQLNGANQSVQIPNSPSVQITGPITVEAWINRAVTGVQHSIVEKYGCAGLGGYVLRVTANDKLLFGTRDD